MVKPRQFFFAAVAAAATSLGAAFAQFGEAISGFTAAEVWLCERPPANVRSAIKRKEKVTASSLGPVDDILITSYFPWNGIVGLVLADEREVFVEYSSIDPVDDRSVAEKMNADVPPGTCIDAAGAGSASDSGRKSGVRRAFGGC